MIRGYYILREYMSTVKPALFVQSTINARGVAKPKLVLSLSMIFEKEQCIFYRYSTLRHTTMYMLYINLKYFTLKQLWECRHNCPYIAL